MNEMKAAFLADLGKRIKKYRIESGLSLEELAHRCGYNSENCRSTMQKIESGKSDIPSSKITLLANALGVTVDKLMGWEIILPAAPDLPVRPLCPPGYDKLDEIDRAKADGYIEALLAADKYKKTTASEAM